MGLINTMIIIMIISGVCILQHNVNELKNDDVYIHTCAGVSCSAVPDACNSVVTLCWVVSKHTGPYLCCGNRLSWINTLRQWDVVQEVPKRCRGLRGNILRRLE